MQIAATTRPTIDSATPNHRMPPSTDVSRVLPGKVPVGTTCGTPVDVQVILPDPPDPDAGAVVLVVAAAARNTLPCRP
jgi:hypothetical protein